MQKGAALAFLASLLEEPDDELARALHHVRVALLTHPVAARPAFRALVAEGREYAKTEAGREWSDRLSGSELVQRGRSVFDVASAGLLSDEPERILPSHLIDAFSHAVSIPDLESALSRAAQPRRRGRGRLSRTLGRIRRVRSTHALDELALGMAASFAKLDAVLDRYAPERRRPSRPKVSESTTILAILGLLAIRDRFRAAVATSRPRAPTSTTDPVVPFERDLFR